MFQFEIVKNEFRKHPNFAIQLPKRSTKNACAYDFFAPCGGVIPPGESLLLWTDVKAVIPSKYMLMINVRSSMGKSLIGLANTQGWIDSDYANNPSNDGNIGILLRNWGTGPYVLCAGDRIAQGMILKYFIMDDERSDTGRSGGFGSTGK